MTRITIDINNQESINRAIVQLEETKKKLHSGLRTLVEQLGIDAVEFARTEYLDLTEQESLTDFESTGDLIDSIESIYNAETNTAVVTVGVDYAIYVEFGTGIVGKGSPHPTGGGNYSSDGWWYHREDSATGGKGGTGWFYTEGYASRPFMYNTWLWVKHQVEGMNR